MTHSLAWVTPFGRASDIGAFSRNILLDFASAGPGAGISPSVVVHENGPTYWTELPTIPLTGGAADTQMLAAYDFRIFNIGNNHENHHYINQLALRIPGVVVVHDLVMQHYLAWKIFEQQKRPEVYARLMAEYYGMSGLDIVASSRICSALVNPIYAPWDTPHVNATPLIEPFVQTAAAVVVHSEFAEKLLRPLFDGPMLRLQLPWDKKESLDDAQLESWVKVTRNRHRCLIAAFGHIGRNKCLETVVQAFAESAVLREHARLIIAGYPGDPHYIEQLRLMVSHLGLGQLIDFEFSISEQRLDTLKRDADIFVNLRYPNTESASGSLNEQLNAGKPVVIYPTGAYAEVDDRGAVKVDRLGGAPAVAAALEKLTTDAAARVRIGKAGRAFVRRIGRREYVAQLSAFLLENAALLRQRGACIAGRNLPAALPTRAEVGPRWAAGLARARWLFGALDCSPFELDLSIFRDWDDRLLARYIVVGLFGHARGGTLDDAVQAMLQNCDRWQVAQAVGEAYVLARLARGQSDPGGRMVRLAGAVPALNGETWRLLAALEPALFIRACYLGLLGRVAEPAEVDLYVVRLSNDNAHNIVREFISSEEFAQRGIAADLLRSLREWSANAPKIDLSVPEIPLGVPVLLSDTQPESASFLTAGWHATERDGVWSHSTMSGLHFRLPPLGPGLGVDKPLALAITGRVVAARTTGPRAGTVVCNDGPPAEWLVDHDDWFTLQVNLPPLSGGNRQVRVAIACNEVVNLSSLQLAADNRDLGFCLRKLVVTNGAEAA
jgi:glycosyltransferase involved in cell wall biosynthesis